jgi:hypothetical protein
MRSVRMKESRRLVLPRNSILYLRTTGNFPRCTPVRDLHTAFNLPHVYDYITKLCRQQADVIQNHEHVRGIGQRETDNIWGLNLAVVKLTTVQVTKLPLWHRICKTGKICFAKPVQTKDMHTVQKQEFSITCCKCDTYTWRKAKHIRDNPILLSGRMLR